MLDGNEDSDNEFDNLLQHVGGKQFFENILGGIERQGLNSFESESSSSSESESDSGTSSDESISPLYVDSSSSNDSEADAKSEIDDEAEESPLFEVIDEEVKSEIDDEAEESPLFEVIDEEVKEAEQNPEESYESDISPFISSEDEPEKKKTVADVKKIITDMSKLL